MRPNYFLPFILMSSVVASCDDRENQPYVPDPVYAEMHEVTSITSTNATLTLKVKYLVTKTADGNYFQIDNKYLTDYGFFYTTDKTRPLHLWQNAVASVQDDSGTYSIEVSDLSPGTQYHVKAYVFAFPELRTQQYNFNIGEHVLEFTTP